MVFSRKFKFSYGNCDVLMKQIYNKGRKPIYIQIKRKGSQHFGINFRSNHTEMFCESKLNVLCKILKIFQKSMNICGLRLFLKRTSFEIFCKIDRADFRPTQLWLSIFLGIKCIYLHINQWLSWYRIISSFVTIVIKLS